MRELMSLEQFKQNEIIKYGTAATSASANHAPVFIKEELNNLYNYTKMKFSELPLEWDPQATYKVDDVVAHNGNVYIATANNGNQEPPSVAWGLFNTDSIDLELKYVQIHTDKYINLLTRNSYKMMRADENSTTAIMSPKNGLVPWDNGTNSDLGKSDLRWNDIYCVNGHYSNVNTAAITATSGSIGTLSGTSLDFNSGDIGSLSGNTLDFNSGTVDTLNSTTINTTNLTASSKITASTMKVTTGEISSLSGTSLNFNSGTISSLSGTSSNFNSGTISSLSGTSLDFDSGTIDTLSGNTLNFNLGTITTLNSTTMKTKNLTASAKITASTMKATTFDGTSTKAKYADLAEKYTADVKYEPGTVLGFGGEKELSIYNEGMTVAGVVSTKPGYMLNSELENGIYIALKGRVPCKIIGEATAGMYIIAANDGLGIAAIDYTFDESKKLLGVAITSSKDGIVEIKV